MQEYESGLLPLRHKSAVKFVFMRTILSSSEYCELHYVEERAAGSYMVGRPVLMEDVMADFIRTYCRCVHCHQPIQDTLERCGCGKQTYCYIRAEYPKSKEEYLVSLHITMTDRELARRKKFNRESRLERAGNFTKAQVMQLLDVQDGCCYYCSLSLYIADKPKFHIDHYVPLLDGGKNEISNLVLSCSQCNLRKGTHHPDQFIRRRNRELAPEAKIKAQRIRTKVKAYKGKLTV